MIDFLFGTAPGVVTDPDQLRAMSQEDVAKMQYAHFVAQSNHSAQVDRLEKLALKAIMEGKVTDLPLCGDSRQTLKTSVNNDKTSGT